jgi:cytochrome c oxidase cbb3-type subunit 3
MTRAALAILLLLAACEREDREPRSIPTAVESPDDQSPGAGRRYERSAYQISEGERYFRWFNCNGCHGSGGGAMGPPLMDDAWVYGGEIQQIAASIAQGRPNGMPSFRGRVPDEQIWQLAAYVRSMPRHVRKDLAPGRRDHLHARPSPSSIDRVEPRPDERPGPP